MGSSGIWIAGEIDEVLNWKKGLIGMTNDKMDRWKSFLDKSIKLQILISVLFSFSRFTVQRSFRKYCWTEKKFNLTLLIVNKSGQSSFKVCKTKSTTWPACSAVFQKGWNDWLQISNWRNDWWWWLWSNLSCSRWSKSYRWL